jgi:tryptophan synthase alpha chain
MKLMTHVVVGYPTLKDTVNIVKAMANAGVDIIELQIPFSDPLADGPTIMKACERALENGTKVKDAMTVMKSLSRQVSIPLFFMAYYNTIFRYGTDRFCFDAKTSGAAGLIVPDMALEEESTEHFIASCKKYSLHNIQVVSPASTDKRLAKNADVASGFVYATARQGITGAKNTLDPQLRSYIANVKKYFSVPVAVGFGISKKEHINALKGHADIAVLGSAIIDILNCSKPDEYQKNIHAFLTSLRP